MPPSLVFDMHDGETAGVPATAKVVTQKRKATGDAVTIVYRGVGPVADIKEGFGMPLLELAVVEDIDTSKRSRAVLTALGDGSVGAVLLPPVHEKTVVKAAYLTDQGTQKALVPWAKLSSMHDTTWMGPYMTISDALKEYTKPKSRVPAAVKEAATAAQAQAQQTAGGVHSAAAAAKATTIANEPSKKKATVALPTVTVPKPIHEIRRVTPSLSKRKVVEASDSEDIDLTRASEDSGSEDGTDDEEAETDESSDENSDQDGTSEEDTADMPVEEDAEEPEQSEEEVDTDDAESGAGSENESEDERPAKRRRTFEVTAKYLDDDREMIATFKVRSTAEMNRVFSSFRESGCV